MPAGNQYNELSSAAIYKCLREKTIPDAEKQRYLDVAFNKRSDEECSADPDLDSATAFRSLFLPLISGRSQADKDQIALCLFWTREHELLHDRAAECLLDALMAMFKKFGVTEAVKQKVFSGNFVTYLQNTYNSEELRALLTSGFEGLEKHRQEEAAKKAEEEKRAAIEEAKKRRYGVGDLDQVVKNVVEDLGRGEDKSPINAGDLKILVEKIREKSTEFIRDRQEKSIRFDWTDDSAKIDRVTPVDNITTNSTTTLVVITTSRTCEIENNDGYGSYGGAVSVDITVDVATKKVVAFKGGDCETSEEEIVAAFNGAAAAAASKKE